jgi:hypothetical protein
MIDHGDCRTNRRTQLQIIPTTTRHLSTGLIKIDHKMTAKRPRFKFKHGNFQQIYSGQVFGARELSRIFITSCVMLL